MSVSLDFADKSNTGPFKPGDSPAFVIKVINNGPGDASGIAVHVDLPTTMHYRSSTIVGFGNARTQALDARVGTSAPVWGFWDLAAPASGSTLCQSCVQIAFTADIQSTPGDYTMVAHAQGDNTSGDVASNPIKFTVTGAPRLDVSARVQAGTLHGNSTATYVVTITNAGTGPAGNLSLLVTLPPVMTFQKSVTPFAGNASRNKPIDPVKGSVEVFYSGWTLPGASGAGPGFLAVVFAATVALHPVAGVFTITCQVTDDAGDMVTLTSAAPVTVLGSTPSPQPAVTALPTSS